MLKSFQVENEGISEMTSDSVKFSSLKPKVLFLFPGAQPCLFVYYKLLQKMPQVLITLRAPSFRAGP